MVCNSNSNNNLDKISYKCYMKDIYLSEAYYKYSCELCGINYFQIFDDSNNNNSYINCYYYPEGYYFDLP